MDGQPVDTESAGSGYAVSTRANPPLGDIQYRNPAFLERAPKVAVAQPSQRR